MPPRVATADHVLFASLRLHSFRATEQDRLEQHLRQLDRQLVRIAIHEPQQLRLAESGETTADGYRYSRAAFSQLCRLLCPGLYRVIADLALSSQPDLRPDSLRYATDLWNQMVQLRYPVLQRRTLLRHRDDRVVEGVLGPGYVPLENLSLYEMLRDSLAAEGLEFAGASVTGVRMCLWWRSPQVQAVLATPQVSWDCSAGAYFANSEVDGVAVRGLPIVLTPAGAATAPYAKGARLRHAGRQFRQRVTQICRRVLSHLPEQHSVLGGASERLSRSLGFVADMDAAARETVMQRICHDLIAVGVPATFAKEIGQDAIIRGCQPDRVPFADPNRVYPHKKVADLFAAVLRAARKLDLSRRERLEQAAYRLLLNTDTTERQEQ